MVVVKQTFNHEQSIVTGCEVQDVFDRARSEEQAPPEVHVRSVRHSNAEQLDARVFGAINKQTLVRRKETVCAQAIETDKMLGVITHSGTVMDHKKPESHGVVDEVVRIGIKDCGILV
jgi:hypothetical protein